MGEGAPDLSAFWLSLRVAGTAVLLVAPLGALAAWWLAHGRPFRGRLLVEVVLTLPLVLPPTAVGFGLLLLLGHGTAVGRWVNETVGLRLLFTWQGAALAAAVMALPLFVRTAEAAFASVDEELLEAGRTLGVPERALLLHVIVPLSYRGLLAGLALAFARALGEFGATLMVAGSIPGRTQTLSIAVYEAVQAGQDDLANLLVIIVSITCVVVLLFVGRLSPPRAAN